MSGGATLAAAERGSKASRAAAHRPQAKLTLGPSNDAFEQEADRVSQAVVSRNSAPAVDSPAGLTPVAARAAPKVSRLADRTKPPKGGKEKEEPQPKLQRQEDEEPQAKLQRQEDEEPQAKLQRQEDEEPQAKLQRQEDEEPQAKLQRQEDEEPQAKLQRQEDEEPQAKLQRQEEEEPQARLQRQEEEEPQAKLQRQEDEEPQAKLQRQEEEEAQASPEVRANVRDKRMYPALDRVEGKLFENKGKGEPLDDKSRIAMETGFGADFGSVRVHTGADAVGMSRELKAQAFTHGKDVFFNTGKYEPDTTRGRGLLAHELTHVVQQGAAEQRVPDDRVEASNAKRDERPAEPADAEALQVEETTEQAIARNEPGPGGPAAAGESPATTGTDAAPPAAAADGKPVASEAEAEGEGSAPSEAEAKGGEGEQEAQAAPPGGGKGKAPTQEGAAPASEGKKGLVGAFLRKVTEPIFQSKKKAIGRLATAEKRKEDAGAKLTRTEKAVVPPAEESASRSKASQVESVERAPEPQPDEQLAKERFESTLQAAVPATLEEVDEFKEEGKGRVVGQAVKGVVAADTQSVRGTYQEIENPPAPAPPETTPEELPPIEAAAETPAIAPGDGLVGEVQAEHTDVSNFEKESDAQLEKEGIKDEHLEMVDEGELAEANKERKGLKTKVKEGPKEVQQLEKRQKEDVGKELQKEELGARDKMRAERQKGLAGARGDQQKTKSKLELERQQVTDHINGIYQRANDTVKQKLSDLETTSLKAFETGEKQATKTFENNVKRRIDAFKKRRYDRFGGSLLWAKDKLFGMDDLPEVKGIFDSEKSAFVTAIDALVAKITADNKRVIAECKEIVATAKAEIETFVAGLRPKLKQTGQDALGKMKSKLAALDSQINAKEKELQKKLQEKREAAIKAIEEKIEAMKEEMSGLVSKLGNLLLNAMIKFFKWALTKAGLAADQLMAIINKGKAVIGKIVKDPIGFIGNLVKAVKNGIGLFVTNIKKHLIGGLVSWLTGAMADVPIQLPAKWDLKGILHLVLQVMGLTWARIRQKLVKRLGEKVVKIAETSVDIVKRLVTEGPIALWEMIKAKAAEIKQKVMDGIRNWLIVQLVKQAVFKLVSFLNPAGAIVQAILAIYNVIMFFVENIQRIIAFVKSVFDSVGNIAMGKLSAAAQAVERAMAMTIPIILNFLARFIGLSGIGKTVTKIIKKIRKPIDKVVDKVIDKVVGFARKLVGKAKAGAKALKDKALTLIQWWKGKKAFRSKDGGDHKLYYVGVGKQARLTVASNNPDDVQNFLNKQPKQAGLAGAKSKYKEVRKWEQAVGRLQAKSPGVTGKEAKRAHRYKIDTARESLWSAIGVFSDKIEGMEFEKASDLFIKTQVTPTSGAKASSVRARPLTWLSGNTQGSPPAEDPPGWAHAKSLPDKWERGHLLSMHFHGPGEKWNLVPITTATNSKMKTVENSVKPLVAKKGNVLHYKTTIKSWHKLGPPADNSFPHEMKIRWGFLKAKVVASGSMSFSELPGAKNIPFTQGPPALAGAAKNINDFGSATLAELTGTTVRFMMAVLDERDARGRFSSYTDLRDRMKKHQSHMMGGETMRKHLASVYHANRQPNKKIDIRA